MEFNIEFILKGIGIMILIGIDVAKDKHDCFIQTTEGKVLCKTFSFANNYDGFEELYAKILSCNDSDIRVGLEATGHYSYNLLGFLLSKELPTFFQPSSNQSISQKFIIAQNQNGQG